MQLPIGVWGHYGFSSSPYSTSALQVADTDQTLLVGRDQELKTVLRDLMSGTQMVALEGDYGVGKSSLAAVARSIASRWRQQKNSVAPLFLASGKPLELEEKDTASSLERRAYYQVAGSILANEDRLAREGVTLRQLGDFRFWLTTPVGRGWSAGIGASFPNVIGANLSGSRTQASNTSAGFTEAGVITMIVSRAVDASPSLRSKRDLVEDFVASISVHGTVDEQWRAFVAAKREAEFADLIADEQLRPEGTREFLDAAFRDGQLRTTGTAITKILPPVSRFAPDGGHGDRKKSAVAALSRFFERFFGLDGGAEA